MRPDSSDEETLPGGSVSFVVDEAGRGLPGLMTQQNRKQLGDSSRGIGGMAQDPVGGDPVDVRTAFPAVGEVPTLLQVRDDLLDRPLGEPTADGDVTDPYGVVLGDGSQHPGVVRQKGPACMRFRCSIHCLRITSSIHAFK